MKTWNDIEDCDECPLFKEVCPGGVTGHPNGPHYPPCCDADPNEDVDALLQILLTGGDMGA